MITWTNTQRIRILRVEIFRTVLYERSAKRAKRFPKLMLRLGKTVSKQNGHLRCICCAGVSIRTMFYTLSTNQNTFICLYARLINSENGSDDG